MVLYQFIPSIALPSNAFIHAFMDKDHHCITVALMKWSHNLNTVIGSVSDSKCARSLYYLN
jgi:hypothetical protein